MDVVLREADWRAQARAHAAQVDAWTADHLRRRRDEVKHPVEDFLFTYYSHRPAQLRRWHPGAGVVLENGEPRKGYVRTAEGSTADVDGFLAARGGGVEKIGQILVNTARRPALTACFGLHEWAMVYRGARRHEAYPLRLGQDGTDAHVEASKLRCTHIDAFRFFTEAARPRNAQQLTRETQADVEQPGCLHATMDLYKWCYKLEPLTPSHLTARAFALARDVRQLDMQASPYDLGALGLAPVKIETPAGRAEYVRRQKGLAARGQVLRGELIALLRSHLLLRPT